MSKRKLVYAGFALIPFMFSQAHAQGVSIIGAGYMKCSTLVERDLFKVSDPPVQWAAGFISGVSSSLHLLPGKTAAADTFNNKLKKLTASDIGERVKAYCTNNEDDRLYEGVDAIIKAINYEG